MERICPLLGLAADQRTVVDGYDPEHRCLALEEPAPLDRSRQVQLCLTEAHVRCERLAAARHRPRAASAARVPPDVAFVSTRLTLEPDAAWRTLGSGRLASRSRSLLLVGATGAAAALAVAVASNAGMFSGGVPASPSSTAQPSLSGVASPAGSPGPSGSASSTPAATGQTPAATATQTVAPTPRSYVVKSGDTLGLIAAQFGTTVSAIQQANGLGSSTIINVGQVLVIP